MTPYFGIRLRQLLQARRSGYTVMVPFDLLQFVLPIYINYQLPRICILKLNSGIASEISRPAFIEHGCVSGIRYSQVLLCSLRNEF